MAYQDCVLASVVKSNLYLIRHIVIIFTRAVIKISCTKRALFKKELKGESIDLDWIDFLGIEFEGMINSNFISHNKAKH